MDAVLALAIILNVGIGVWNSPVLALRRVHLVGAQAADRSAIDGIIQGQAGTAALGIKGLALESAVQQLPEVDSATFNANVFGSGRLIVRYRTPIARVGAAKLALDAEGRVWRTRQPLDGLPSVGLPAGALNVGLALTRSAPLVGIAELAQKLPKVWPEFKGEIVLDAAGTVCLNREDSGRVVLGGTDAMDEKLSRLAGLLRDHPDLFVRSHRSEPDGSDASRI